MDASYQEYMRIPISFFIMEKVRIFASEMQFLFVHLQMAIPILIGTKFDDFVKLPPDLQSTIVTQVRRTRMDFPSLTE